MKRAIDIINNNLLESGIEQSEIDSLIDRLFKEEMETYIQSSLAYTEDENCTDRMIKILNFIGFDFKEILFLF